MKRVQAFVVVVVLMFGSCGLVQAAAIGSPSFANGWDTTSAVSATGSHPGYTDREWIYTINGAGLDEETGTLHESVGPFGGPYVSMGIASGAANPRGGTINTSEDPNGYGDRWIEYSFDQIYEVDRMAVWAYNENADYTWASFTCKDVYIEVSTTGGTDPAEWTFVAELILGHSTFDLGGIPVTTTVDFGGVEAKYVVITLRNGREGTYAKGNLGIDSPDFGLSEVRFYDTTYTGPANCGAEGTVYLEGDINEDCYVNLIDVAMFGNEWLGCTDPANNDCDPYWR